MRTAHDTGIFVKVENESNNFEIMQYDGASHSAINNNNDRLMSELSDIRQKYSEIVFQHQKAKESLAVLNAENHRLVEEIEDANRKIDLLTNENDTFGSRICAVDKKMSKLQVKNDALIEGKKIMESSINSLQQGAVKKDNEIGQLRKELKSAQARLKQNQSGTQQNIRYFREQLTQEIENNYEVKQLLSHRNQKSKREFLVQWKETWEPEASLNCPILLSAYLRKHQ